MVSEKNKKNNKENRGKKNKSAVCNIFYIRYSLISNHQIHCSWLITTNQIYFESAMSGKSWEKIYVWLIKYMVTWYHLQWQVIVDEKFF